MEALQAKCDEAVEEFPAHERLNAVAEAVAELQVAQL